MPTENQTGLTLLPGHESFKGVRVVPGMTEAEYRPLPAMNASALRCLSTLTPAHWSHQLANPERTTAMAMGSALHAAVLEPVDFFNRYAVAPECDRRTTAGKATWADFLARNAGREPLKQEDFEVVEGMRDGLIRHADCKMWLDLCASREVVLVGELDGLQAKAKIDAVTMSQGYYLDVKSMSGPATLDNCRRESEQRGYFLAMTFYRRMLRAAGVEVNGAALLFVEKERPWCARALPIDPLTLDAMELEVDAAIVRYRRWLVNPAEGWVSDEVELSLSPWKRKALVQ